MKPSEMRKIRIGGLDIWMALAGIASALLLIFAATQTQAQTFHVLHSFSGFGDGGQPTAGLTLDRAGNLYGTTEFGAISNAGTVFKLSHAGSGWVVSTLYAFRDGSDGGNPSGRVVFGPDGGLYGTTSEGGLFSNTGTVFELRPPATVCHSVSCPWTHTVLYRFGGGGDGYAPGFEDLVFDRTGNVYGTTTDGGLPGCLCGDVFQLTPSGGTWTESILYRFAGGDDGSTPYSGVIFDSAGNLYGSTFEGGANGEGTVFELSPSGAGWTETTLTDFSGGSGFPLGGLTFDAQGNLFGTGFFFGGTVFELQPSGGSWSFSQIAVFDGNEGPSGALTFDNAGNIYGSNASGGPSDDGFVFKLTPSPNGWTVTHLHDFNGDDGYSPMGNVVIDGSGNLYGTTLGGGTNGQGVAWEITP